MVFGCREVLISGLFSYCKNEIGDVTFNALYLVDVLSSKVVSSSLKERWQYQGKSILHLSTSLLHKTDYFHLL